MSVWSRPAAASARSGFSVSQIAAMFSGGRSYASADGSDPAQAMQVIAVRSSVDLIASLAAELPGHVYKGVGPSRVKLELPGYLEDPAGDGYGREDWIYQLVQSWLLRGNTYGDVLASRGAVITAMRWFNTDKVTASVGADGHVKWHVGGKLVDNPDRFKHLRVNPIAGHLQGLSPIQVHADQIGVSLTSNRYGKQWFMDGAHPSGMLTNSEVDLDDDQRKGAKAQFMAALFGSLEPIVMGKGWTYQQMQLSPEESQFLQTQGYSAAECARIFGPGVAEILGYESGGSLTYANVESRAAHLLVFAVNKWLNRVERVFGLMLPADQYYRIDRDAVLQSTTLERYRAHETALRNRWKTVNEVRADEELSSVEWGDEPNLTFTGQSFTGEQDPNDPDANATGAEAPAVPKGDS